MLDLIMTEHYYTKNPESKLKINKIKFTIKDKEIELFTASGLFSLSELDRGSELLINKSLITGNKILDLGCGYGAIGISLKLLNPELDVTFSDINERAILITKKNLYKYNLKSKVVQSDGFENINDKFDVVLLNPPQTAGKKLCFKLIEDSKNHLNENGTLQIVVRHNKGGIELSKKMNEVFGNVKDVVKRSGYRVYVSYNTKITFSSDIGHHTLEDSLECSKLSESYFKTKGDKEQFIVSDDKDIWIFNNLQEALNVIKYQDKVIGFVFFLPCSKKLMKEFISNKINEEELFEKIKSSPRSFETIYLCAAFIKAEFRKKGLVLEASLKLINQIIKQHKVKPVLFYWPYSEEGRKLALKIIEQTNLKVEIKKN